MEQPKKWFLPGIAIAMVALTGCAAAQNAPTKSMAGWYSQHAGTSTFQPCGSAKALQIMKPGDLPVRAKAFGLQDDMPVYVKLLAVMRDDANPRPNSGIEVERVIQFGAPTPVRNCAMNGVVHSDKSAARI